MPRHNQKAIEAPGTKRLTVKGVPDLCIMALRLDATSKGQTVEDYVWDMLMLNAHVTMERLKEMQENNASFLR